MLNLRCTNKIIRRCRIDKEHLKENGPSETIFGDWYCTLFEIDGRNATIYMSEKSFLSFIMLEGGRITPEKLSMCLLGGLGQALEMEGFDDKVIDEILRQHEEGSFSSIKDLSISGVMNAIARDYQWIIEGVGGLEMCDIGAIIQHVNTMPRKKIDFASASEKTKELISSIAT
ncbi:Uncharacterised protein [BD1-7 clade bacterium]|uniref:DUF6933 domain-containing protein n=1 Tax=BD1-7 clade bacterium TaxID=2029982 RepID=A0A5S9Q804_9GAMM|nr:Uncharacterised protein [BD1-7 clade bacterium]